MREIKALTSLRGVAAMAVVMQHFSATAQQHSAVTIPSLVPHGYMAVDLFFVLSGFIMAYTYLADFETRGLRAFPDFLLKRVARIVPLNSVTVLLVLAAGWASSAWAAENIFYSSTEPLFDGICNLLMLQGLGIGVNLNAPSWSISTEFAAYIVFPLLIAIVFTRRWVLAACPVLVSLGVVVTVMAAHVRLGLDIDGIGGGLLRCFSEFILGLATFRMFREGRLAGMEKDWAAVAAIGWTGMFLLLRSDVLVALGFPVLVATLACNRGGVARVLASRVPYFLGVISFSIYLLHNIFRPLELAVLRALHPTLLPGPAALGFALVGSLSVIPFAWVAYIAVERPGRRLLRRAARPTGPAIVPGRVQL